LHQEKHLHLLEDEKGISGNDRIREVVGDFIEPKIQEERSVGKSNAAVSSPLASPSAATAGGGGSANAATAVGGGSASAATAVGSDAAVVGTVASPSAATAVGGGSASKVGAGGGGSASKVGAGGSDAAGTGNATAGGGGAAVVGTVASPRTASKAPAGGGNAAVVGTVASPRDARVVLTYVAIWYSKQLQNEPNSTTSSLTTKETNNSIPSNKDYSTFQGRLDQEVETLKYTISILGSIANPAGASALFRKVRDSGMSWYASQTEELERRKLLAAAYVMVDEKKKCVNSLIDQVNSKHKEKGIQKTDSSYLHRINELMSEAGDLSKQYDCAP